MSHTRKNGGKWGERTVRNGRIRWFGQDYVPTPHTNHRVVTVAEAAAMTHEELRHVDLAYDGRLDELRYAFARYRGHYPGGPWLPFVQLWGTEGQFRGWTPIEEYGPELVDGCFPWMHWALAPGQEGT